jgi:hypothetical protein
LDSSISDIQPTTTQPESGVPALGESTRTKRPFEQTKYRIGDTLPSSSYDFIVPDFLIKGGTTLLSGDPKSGKSTVAKNLAYSVATGKPFLGREVTQGRVLYFQLDDSPSWTLHTLRLMNDGTIFEGIEVTERGEFQPQHYIEILRTEFELNPAISLMIIDTLSKALDVDNFNDYKPLDTALGRLANFAHETGVSLLMLHHAGKDESRSDIKAPLGSAAITAAVDIPLVVRKKGADQGTISGQGRRTREIEVHYEFDHDTHRVNLRDSAPVIGPAAQRLDATDARKAAIIAHLKAHSGESTQTAIFADRSIRGDDKAKRSTLGEMAVEGRVAISDNGRGKRKLVKLVDNPVAAEPMG